MTDGVGSLVALFATVVQVESVICPKSFNVVFGFFIDE